MKYVLTAGAFLALVVRPAYGQVVQPHWGQIHASTNGMYRLEVQHRPDDGRLEMPTPFAHVTRCYANGDGRPRTCKFEFNQDASELAVLLPSSGRGDDVTNVIVETAETTQQFDDGRIVFSARDADVIGKTARLESHPGNYRIGFWTDADDYVSWSFDATRWGKYTVCLTYSTASPDGSQIEIDFGDTKTSVVLQSTGSWYRYTTLMAGPVYLGTAGKRTVDVRCKKQVGGAVMNLKAVTLVPACEGQPPVQRDDGVVVLHGRDATVRGTMLRYEPAEKKQTLGYWVRPSDMAEWRFTLKRPGAFDVEVLQGCGPGQGGSEMQVTVGEEQMTFVVEDTGHFQNFQPRIVGRVDLPSAGAYTLSVAPKKIARQAALDLRQIRLLPVE